MSVFHDLQMRSNARGSSDVINIYFDVRLTNSTWHHELGHAYNI